MPLPPSTRLSMLLLAEFAQVAPCKMRAYYKMNGLLGLGLGLGLGKGHIGGGWREAPRCLISQHGLEDNFLVRMTVGPKWEGCVSQIHRVGIVKEVPSRRMYRGTKMPPPPMPPPAAMNRLIAAKA